MTAAAKKESKSKHMDDNIAQIVAEEKATRSKFPRYPNLDRYKLIEKMGDGAFSNVYRARDTHNNNEEVAIKVVRKFEMNSMQVSQELGEAAFFLPQACPPSLFRVYSLEPLPNYPQFFLPPLPTRLSLAPPFFVPVLPTRGRI